MNRRKLLQILGFSAFGTISGLAIASESIAKIGPLNTIQRRFIFEKIHVNSNVSATTDTKYAWGMEVGDYMDLIEAEANERNLMGTGRYRRVS